MPSNHVVRVVGENDGNKHNKISSSNSGKATAAKQHLATAAKQHLATAAKQHSNGSNRSNKINSTDREPTMIPL
jgi:hypothetical protein